MRQMWSLMPRPYPLSGVVQRPATVISSSLLVAPKRWIVGLGPDAHEASECITMVTKKARQR